MPTTNSGSWRIRSKKKKGERVKITLPNGTKIEMDDPEPMEPMPESAAEAAAKAKSTPEAKPMDTKPSASKQPKPESAAPATPERAKSASAPIPEEPTRNADFVNVISDPNAGKPGYFQFQMPREE